MQYLSCQSGSNTACHYATRAPWCHCALTDCLTPSLSDQQVTFRLLRTETAAMLCIHVRQGFMIATTVVTGDSKMHTELCLVAVQTALQILCRQCKQCCGCFVSMQAALQIQHPLHVSIQENATYAEQKTRACTSTSYGRTV